MNTEITDKCFNEKSLDGDALTSVTPQNIIIFIDIRTQSGKGFCFTSEELFRSFTSYMSSTDEQNRPAFVVEFRPEGAERVSLGIRKEDKPLYKLPYTGEWVDSSVIDAFRNGWNTILLTNKKKVLAGSQYGVGVIFDTYIDVFEGAPIHRDAFLRGDMNGNVSLADRKPEDISNYGQPIIESEFKMSEKDLEKMRQMAQEQNRKMQEIQRKRKQNDDNIIITYLSQLPDDITVLDISKRRLRELPDLSRFENLRVLDCSNNNIQRIRNLPDTLEQLICSNNIITTIHRLPDNLQIFICDNNDLIRLPPFPDYLNIIQCSNNDLTTLPALPNGLTVLDCSRNRIAHLPALPDSLNVLKCNNNHLEEIITFPRHLEVVNCSNNILTDIPAHEHVAQFKCDNNLILNMG